MPMPDPTLAPLFSTDDDIMPDTGRASDAKSVQTITVQVSPQPPSRAPDPPPQAPVKYQAPSEQVKLEQENRVPERNDICARHRAVQRCRLSLKYNSG
jgi:hypothetical protein